MFILLNANKITREQVKLNEELTSPTFIISQESYLDDKVEIKNVGGKVSHLFVERIDEIYVRYRGQNILVSIKLFNSDTSSKNKIWYFTPNSKKYDYYELYGDEGKYTSSSELNERKFVYHYDFFISDDDYLNTTYENILSSLNKYIDYRNNRLNITTKNE